MTKETKAKTIKDFETLLNKGFALPNTCIEEQETSYVFHKGSEKEILSFDEAKKLLTEFKKN